MTGNAQCAYSCEIDNAKPEELTMTTATALHPFERAALGLAPFRCVGVSEKTYQACADAPVQSAGMCHYCGQCIRWAFAIKSSDGKVFDVGSDCVGRVGGDGSVEDFRAVRLEHARQRRAVSTEVRRAARDAAWAVERENRRQEREAWRAERALEWQAAHGDLVADIETFAARNDFLSDMARAIREFGYLTERQTAPAERCIAAMKRTDAERAKSRHLGAVGERVKNMKARVTSVRYICRVSRYPLIERFLVKLETESGAVLIWWTGEPKTEHDDFRPVAFTVKGHDSYDGVAQTTVQRVAFKAVKETA